jgi:hypothetical protein
LRDAQYLNIDFAPYAIMTKFKTKPKRHIMWINWLNTKEIARQNNAPLRTVQHRINEMGDKVEEALLVRVHKRKISSVPIYRMVD